jgi:nucleoside-diphosphate-sugar epimerase
MSDQFKILVTGGNGFIGQSLVRAFLDQNHHVCSLDISPCSFNDKNLTSATVNLLEAMEVQSILQSFNPDYIFHLAAFNSNPGSFKNPKNCFDLNFRATLNILDELRSLSVKRFFLPSSYYLSIQQTQEYFDSPYTLSKKFQEDLCRHYNKFFNIPVTIFRLANVYGKTSSKETLIGSLVSRVVSGEKNIQLGELNLKRDFIFLDDVANALISLLNSKHELPETLEVGSGEEVLLKDLVEIVKEETNFSGEMKCNATISASNMTSTLITHPTFLKETLGWIPQYNMRRGLIEVINAMKKNVV